MPVGIAERFYQEIHPGTGGIYLNISGTYVFVGWFHRNDPSATNYPEREYFALEPGTVLNNTQSNQQVRLEKIDPNWGDDLDEADFKAEVCALSSSGIQWDIHVHEVKVTDPA